MSDKSHDGTPPRLGDVVRDLRHLLVTLQRRGLVKLPRSLASLANPVASALAGHPPPLDDAQTAADQGGRQPQAPAATGNALGGTGDVELAASGTKRARLDAFYNAVGPCRRCFLAKDRKTIVFSSGNPDAAVMLIGEGPGKFEDIEGVPFVGPSGKLLTRMLRSVGLNRESEVFITNVVKCRPPGNRDPETMEVTACRFIIEAQLAVVQPKIIVIAGLQAAKALLGPNITLTAARQKRHRIGDSVVLVTYHPSFLLRQPPKKADAWQDLLALRTLMIEQGLAAPIPPAWWK